MAEIPIMRSSEGPEYALTVDKLGLKMKVNESPEDGALKVPINPNKDGFVIGTKISMRDLWLVAGAGATEMSGR